MAKKAATIEPKGEAAGIPVYCAFDEIVDIGALVGNPRNPNRHDDEQIRLLAKIIQHQGWRAPITVSNRSGFIVRGHGRLMAAKVLKVSEVPIDRQDYATEAEEWADLIADNRLAELATPDMPDLKDLLQELDTGALDMELTGYTEQAMADLMSQFHVDEEPQEVEAPEPPKTPVTQAGDVWLCGDGKLQHRVMCGDSTDAGSVALLMAGEKAGLTLTDPPYSVNYDRSHEERGGSKLAHESYHEAEIDPSSLLSGFLACLPSDVLVMTYPVDRHFFDLADALRNARLELRKELVWVKDTFSFWPGAKYQQRHEPILVIARKGTPVSADVPANQSTVFEIARPKAHDKHPTQKPMELWSSLMTFHVGSGQGCYDPFLGSGTTMIAAEQLGRRAFGMEIAPQYCDVSVRRWQKLTEREPILEATGETFSQVAASRGVEVV